MKKTQSYLSFKKCGRRKPTSTDLNYEYDGLLNNKHLKYIEEARLCAERSVLRTKHGSVLVKNSKIISVGYNRFHSDSSVFDDDLMNSRRSCRRVSRHAEEDALRNCDTRQMNGAILYVIRWGCGTEGNPVYMNSTPCPRCHACIQHCMDKYGLKAVYYTI
jgi:deoxycytidylate deaminase